MGFYGHEQEDADYFFRNLGFDFIKVDFCGDPPHQNTDRLELDEQERYTAISRAIKIQVATMYQYMSLGFPGNLGRERGLFVAHIPRYPQPMTVGERYHPAKPMLLAARLRCGLTRNQKEACFTFMPQYAGLTKTDA